MDISTLLKENINRLDNDYYEYRLEAIKSAFEAKIHGEKNTNVVNGYRKALKTEIQMIYQILQNMDLDFDYEPVFDAFGDLAYHYENQIIFEPWKGILSRAVENLKKPLGDYVDLNAWETIEELQILVRAGWWMYNKTNVKQPDLHGQPTDLGQEILIPYSNS